MNSKAKVSISFTADEWNTLSALLGYIGRPEEFTATYMAMGHVKDTASMASDTIFQALKKRGYYTKAA